MPSRSVACALLVPALVLLLLAAGTTAAAGGNGDAASGNMTTTATITSGGNNSSATVPAGNNSNEMYTCYFCSGRNLLMIHFCPIYWDECHLLCSHDDAASSAATAAVRDDATGSGAVSPAVVPTGETTVLDGANPGDDDECYVMKLYDDKRYVIVSIVKCGEAKSCYLTCGGGEALGAGNSSASPTAAAFQRPRLADFQRCGDTVVPRGGDRSDRKG